MVLTFRCSDCEKDRIAKANVSGTKYVEDLGQDGNNQSGNSKSSPQEQHSFTV